MSLEALCTYLKKNPQGEGDFITREEAKTTFDQMKLTIHNPDQAVVATLFGLDCLLSFVGKISEYNGDHPEGDPKRISGFRIYKCLDLDRAYFDRHDVFLMPVTTDGEDLYLGFDRTEKLMDPDDLILGNGRPCPNLCTDKLYQFD